MDQSTPFPTDSPRQPVEQLFRVGQRIHYVGESGTFNGPTGTVVKVAGATYVSIRWDNHNRHAPAAVEMDPAQLRLLEEGRCRLPWCTVVEHDVDVNQAGDPVLTHSAYFGPWSVLCEETRTPAGAVLDEPQLFLLGECAERAVDPVTAAADLAQATQLLRTALTVTR